jgi:hypothetical protein
VAASHITPEEVNEFVEQEAKVEVINVEFKVVMN